MKKTLLLLLGGLLLVLAGLGVTLTSVTAVGSSGPPCVPSDAYTETVIITPEVPARDETVIITPARTETIPGTPGRWWNFSPNDQQGVFTGPPNFPSDNRGTWQGPHTEGGPSQGLTGTFRQGEGNASWFHREPGTEERVIEHPAVTDVIHHPAVPAVTDTIRHPAVVCPPDDPPSGNGPPDNPPRDNPPRDNAPPDNPPADAPPSVDNPPTYETVHAYRCGPDGTLVKRTVRLRDGVRTWLNRENTSEACGSQVLNVPEEGM